MSKITAQADADYGQPDVATQSRHRLATITAAGFFALATLAGCANNPLTANLGSPFGAAKPTGAQTTGSVGDPQAPGATQPDALAFGGATAGTGITHGCPRFDAWPEDQHITVFEPGRENEAMGVKHRGEITKTVRECQVEPGRVTVKYGFSGRVLLGPQGKPGIVTFPLSVFVTDAKRQKITTQTVTVTADIPPGQLIGYFTSVETVSFEIPEGTRPGEFQAFVAFNRDAPGAG